MEIQEKLSDSTCGICGASDHAAVRDIEAYLKVNINSKKGCNTEKNYLKDAR